MSPRSGNRLPADLVDDLLRLRLRTSRPEMPDECADLETVALVLAGGATPEEIERAGEHLRACASCAAATQALHDLDRGPAPALAPPASLTERARAWVGRPVTWAAAAACAALVVGAAVFLQQPTDAAREIEFAVKGEADHMDVAVQRKGQRFRLRPPGQLEDGDQLGFFYTAERPGYLALFDLRASGKASLLFPRDASRSGAIAAGSEIPLPDGGSFTRAPGCEWLVAVFSDRPLAIETSSAALRNAAAASGPACDLQPEIAGARTIWVFAAH
jgi:hypothetical protein